MSDQTDTIISLPGSLTIRAYRDSDVQTLAELANNRKIWQNMTDRFPHPYTVDSSKAWISRSTDPGNFIPLRLPPKSSNEATAATPTTESIPSDYAICLNDEPVGGCGLEAHPQSPRSISLGYWLGEPYWDRGIATAVATAISGWAFDTFDWLVRIDADAYSWNEGSQKVLLKAGFVSDGRQKWKAFKDGKFGDLVLFGKLRPGFEPELYSTDAP